MRLRNKFRRWIIAIGLIALAGLAVLDRLCPPDLSRFQATSSIVLARDGSLLHVFETRDGHWRLPVQASDVDPLYIRMLCAYEDKRFYHHPGIDPLAMARAVAQFAVRGHVVSGGSTLTMQVARLLEPHRRSVGGKLFEMARAVQLEARFSKAEILGMYLTLAPYGGNLEGARAASLAWFGKPPAELTAPEAALLVALPQSPTRRRPDRHPAEATRARDKVLALAVKSGLVQPSDNISGDAAPVPAMRHPFPALAPHFSRALVGTRDGQVIPSTIDAALQARLEAMLGSEMAGTDPHVNAAVLVVDNATRDVLAAIGGRDLQGPGGYVDMTHAVRSPGSTLKPFIYGLAFDDLVVHPDTLIDDTAIEFSGYAPRNFDRQYHGLVTVREALQQSLNIPATAIMQRVGPGRFTGALGHAGVALKFPRGNADPGLAIALGGIGIDLRDLAMLYAGLANRGDVAPLVERLDAPAAPHQALITPVAAWYLTRILADSPMPDGIVSPALTASQGAPDGRIAYKTGTSYGFRDAWAIGYSGARTVGVWVGRVEGTPRPGAYGRNTAAPLLFRIFGDMPAPQAALLTPAPLGALEVTSNGDLPQALRRFGNRRRGADTSGDPHILYPPAASVIDLLPGSAGGWAPITIAATGGTAPFRFFINGAPSPVSGQRQMSWTPDGPGFTTVTVVDAHDRKAVAGFRLKRGE